MDSNETVLILEADGTYRYERMLTLGARLIKTRNDSGQVFVLTLAGRLENETKIYIETPEHAPERVVKQ